MHSYTRGTTEPPKQPDSTELKSTALPSRSLASQVVVYEGLLTSGECGAIIEHAESVGLSRQQYSTTPATRSRDRVGFEHKVWADSLWGHIQDKLPTLVSFCSDMQFSDPVPVFPLSEYEPSGLNPFLRVYRYQVGSSFAPHEDAPYVASDSARSFLTALVYLNGDFTGGETIFYTDRLNLNSEILRIAPKIGSLVIFPHELWHEGSVIQSGSKYVLRSEIMYTRQAQPGT